MRRGAPPAHQATTANLEAAYPFMGGGGLGEPGVLIGQDVFGGSFVYDPFTLYRAGIITSPNMLVAGQIGSAKSSLVKCYLRRQRVFGREAVVVSPKPREYDALAAASGVTPLRIAPGSAVRLNPLDPPVGVTDPDRIAQRREELLVALAEAALRRPLDPHETSACVVALRRAVREAGAAVPVLPAVVRALLWPAEEDARAVATTVEGLAGEGRSVALALERTVTGDLRGMFDGPTSPGVGLEGPVTVIDLSELFKSDALGIVMVCATAWLQAKLALADGCKRIVVVDEAWAILSRLGVARWLRESFKLSRSYGVQNIAVVHRLSDLSAAGSRGSEATAIAEGLLDDTQTRVLFNQSAGQVRTAADLVGLSEVEAELLPTLEKGEALWRVGDRSFLVRHAVAAEEWPLIDTDMAMTGGAG